MKDQTRELLAKASRSLSAADALLAAGHPDFALSRAYYGAFYAAEAYLLEHGRGFSSHAAVIAAFGRHGVKEAGLPSDLHRVLIEGFERRHVADYAFGEEIPAEEAKRFTARASDFVQTIAERLREES